MTKTDKKCRLVRKATKMPNFFETNESWMTANNIDLRLSYFWATHLPTDICEWIFQLFNDNMQEMYNKSQWGYDSHSKKAELFATTARYIIVENDEKIPIAFCHYRFVMDHGSAVLYCFEIQVVNNEQAKGIGTLILNLLQKVANKSGMDKLMATVFAFNEKSLAFFHKLDFVTDETCPDEKDGLDYLILSKKCTP